MTIYLSLLVALVGVLMYGFADKNPKLAEIGRLAFACGLLAFLITFAGADVVAFPHHR